MTQQARKRVALAALLVGLGLVLGLGEAYRHSQRPPEADLVAWTGRLGKAQTHYYSTHRRFATALEQIAEAGVVPSGIGDATRVSFSSLDRPEELLILTVSRIGGRGWMCALRLHGDDFRGAAHLERDVQCVSGKAT